MQNLVTGGAGFIGSHLVKALLERNEKVCVIDDLSTGRIDNISHLKNEIEFVHDSVLNKKKTEGLVKASDRIFHLAASVGVDYVLKNPGKTFEVNTKGTENIMEYASKYEKRIFLTSSSEVYSSIEKYPLKESSCPLKNSSQIVLDNYFNLPFKAYEISKTICEHIAHLHFSKFGLKVTIGRLFNVSGPNQTDSFGMVIPIFVKQAILGQDLTVFGDGNQTRSFIHVLDAVEAIIKITEAKQSIGDVFNIGLDHEIKITDLAKKIKSITRSKSNINYLRYDKTNRKEFFDVVRRVPDISKMKSLIDFTPSYGIDKIIQDVHDYITSQTTTL